MVLTVIMASILAWLMSREIIKENGIGLASAIILIGCAAIGSAVASGKIKHRRLLVCMVTGCVYYLMLLCCTALLFGGQYQGMGETALTVVGGSAAAAFLSLKGEGSTPRKPRKKSGNRYVVQNNTRGN